MAKKIVNLRLPEEMVSRLQETGSSINAAVERDLDRLQRIRSVSLNELKGRFSPDEWKFLADCFNGVILDTVFCTNSQALAAAVQDYAVLNGGAERWKVDLPSFLDTLQGLTGAQTEALYYRISAFWASDEAADRQEWAAW